MIIALTGAGISKASGIPTFAEMGDIRQKLDRSFANSHKEEFQEVMRQLTETCQKAKPNDAHLALKEYNVPIITMNIDSLHSRAGSKNVIEIHGSIQNNDVVLYGDSAPRYTDGFEWIDRLTKNDILLIIGTSFYTDISKEYKLTAEQNGVNVVVINENAEHEVRKFLENNQDFLEDFDSFLDRIPIWALNYYRY